MDHHFIESYEDEREVLRKIDELKQQGCSESDMYVVARSNEQLTMIRLRTDVEYHAAETKGMGRLGIFIRGGAVPPVFTEMSDEVKQSVFFIRNFLMENSCFIIKKITKYPLVKIKKFQLHITSLEEWKCPPCSGRYMVMRNRSPSTARSMNILTPVRQNRYKSHRSQKVKRKRSERQNALS
ncbi:general stress protein [Planomicrobium okeanokoites]|uniref:General stress protein n=1 Tax=Planomicrobium okeanokoites TaxID=244 RepID=A0ABV7KR46_PLAOK|nr:general stress protein [Planomicrobium okeanokoites]